MSFVIYQLRSENVFIEKFDDDLMKLSREMLLVMEAADGIGLAAPQVGINKRLMVFNAKGDGNDENNMVLVNPIIVETSPEKDSREEGCLSFPQINGKVDRFKWVSVDYLTTAGEKKSTKFQGFEARVFQHEYDHLDKVQCK